MTIECPECHMPATVDPEEIPAAGREIQCGHCGFCFVVRPHCTGLEGSEQEQRSELHGEEGLAEEPAQKALETLSDRENGFLQGLPPEALLARDEVPYAIVKAHQTFEEHRAAERAVSFLGQASAEHEIPINEDRAIPQPGDESRESPKKETALESSPFAPERRFWGMRRRVRPSWGRALRWAGLLLAASLLAGALVYVRPSPNILWQALGAWVSRIRTLLPGGGKEGGSIQFSDLNSYFVPGGRGQMIAFVIEGNVTNHYATPCKFIQVKGTLFDAKGDRAAEQTAYCGNILKRQEIQNSAPDRIREILQRPSGAGLSNLSIEPGRSIPFMLVFPDPPENVSEFSVEILGYQKEDQPEHGGQPSAPAGARPGEGDS